MLKIGLNQSKPLNDMIEEIERVEEVDEGNI